jgi:hypothetical protein
MLIKNANNDVLGTFKKDKLQEFAKIIARKF